MKVMQGHCRLVIRNCRTSEHDEWIDPIYAGHLRAGHNDKHARRWLSHRVHSALYYLGKQTMRGEELLDQRTAEAADLEDESEGSPVEWSDAEGDFNIEDDIPLEADNKIYQLSRKWVEKHATMETPSSRRNMEKELSDRSRVRAEEQGSFNEMDGRYHQEATREALLMRSHLQRTYDRGTCYYHKRGWCKNGFGCTLRHYGPKLKSRYFEEGYSEVLSQEFVEEETQQPEYVSKKLKRHRQNSRRWTKKLKQQREEPNAEDEDYVYRHFTQYGTFPPGTRGADPRSSTARSSRD